MRFVSRLAYFLLVPTLALAQNNFVTKTNIFSGEVASNLTPGAPLSVSSTGTVTVGINNTEITASSSVSGTTTQTLLTGMTVTPVAGTYLVIFSTAVTSNQSGGTQTFAIYVAGTQNAGSVRIVGPFAGGALSATSAICGVTTQAVVTVTGSQAITIEWSSTGTAATVTNRTMNIVRLL